ncbi:ABC transporter ATP-binding protein [Acuticoccus mangrovi]|nr:ABC transporter ATP-binding protein [Acuticoccus mangrovi]
MGRSRLCAVNDVSFSIGRGEVMGLVGESGSGKSVTGYSIMGLVDPPGHIVDGTIRLHGKDLRGLPERQMNAIRGDRVSIIFQDPMTALHPTLRIGQQMIDAIRAHRSVSRSEAWRRSRDMLGRVGIPSPGERLSAYPHQLSGGMRQRVCIAIALLNDPDLIIADEPTTGLDVTIQAQILAEMQALVAARGTALIWVTHDLAVVANIADSVAVMYAGSIVERGPTDVVLRRPSSPYTVGLLNSVPSRNQGASRLSQIPGTYTPAVSEEAVGCRFAPRCPRADDACTVFPALTAAATGAPGHEVRCHHPYAAREGRLSHV